jgi:hypothetical protein
VEVATSLLVLSLDKVRFMLCVTFSTEGIFFGEVNSKNSMKVETKVIAIFIVGEFSCYVHSLESFFDDKTSPLTKR